jgi:putative aldouronate transport system substrate-binding protein
MKATRTLSFLNLLAILVFVIALVGCAPTQAPTATQAVQVTKPADTQVPVISPTNTQAPAPSPTNTQPPAPTAAPVSAAGQFPIVTKPITLKILLAATQGVSDYQNNEFTKWLQDKTGIKLEIDVASVNADEAKQKLNLVLASGNLPDMIIGFNVLPDQQEVLAKQGVIIPLDSYIDQYGFELKTVMKEMPQLRASIALTDGKIYGLPDVNDCYHCSLSQKAWIYKPWLDKLGLKVPTTTDELEQVLIAFKTKDPNGNGKADEIPWSAAPVGSWHAELDSFIMNSFVLDNRLTNDRSLYIDNGKVLAAFAQSGWKDGMAYLAKLYKEGLIDPQSFTNNFDKHQALGENPVPIMGFTQAGFMGMFTQINAKSGRWLDYVPVPPLKGPSGLQQIPENPYQAINPGRLIITKATKYPEAAFRLADLFYNYEAGKRNELGLPGKQWDNSQPGKESIGGGVAKWFIIPGDPSVTQQANNWNQAAPRYESADNRMSQEYDPKNPLERMLYENSKNNYAPYGKPNQTVPPLIFTSDQSKRLSELNTTLYNVVDTQFAAFVTGQADVNKGWDAYLQALKTNGLDELLKIYQTAYDAKYKK